MKRAIKTAAGIVAGWGIVNFALIIYDLFTLSSLADAQDAEARQFTERGIEVTDE